MYNQENSIIIKNAIILNIIHNIFNPRETEVDIYNISYEKESRWHQLSFKWFTSVTFYKIVIIARSKMEIQGGKPVIVYLVLMTL